MKLERTKNSINNAIWGFLNKAVMLLGPFIVRTVLIYKLSADYAGLNSLFSSILSILSLSELGFSNAIVYSMYKPIAEDDSKTICALLRLYRKAYRIIGIVILGVGFILTPFLRFMIKGSVPPDVNLYILYFIFLFNTVISYFLFAYKTSLLSAHQREDVVSRNTMRVNACLYVAQVLVLIFSRNFYLYAITIPLSTIAINIINSVTVDRMYPAYKPVGIVPDELKQEIKKQIYGLTIGKVAGATRNTFDSIVISAYFGLTMVTIYNNYYYIINALNDVFLIFLGSITAGVGNKIVTDSEEENYRDFKKFFFIYMWLTIWCVSVLAALYQPFMELWMGDKYMLPEISMILFCIYFFHLRLGDINYVYYQAAGLWWNGRYREVVEAALNITLNFILGKFFGVNGVILATLISMWSIFFYSSGLVYKGYFKHEKVSDYLWSCLRFILTGAVSIALCYIICKFIPNGSGAGMRILFLFCKLIISSAVSFAVTFLILQNDKIFPAAKDFVVRIVKKRNK